MKEYKATDPEMVQAQKDLAEMSNLSDRIITNDKDLFAELGAYLVCSRLEISNLDTKNHAAYLAAWSPMLKSDPKILFKSLANASKAADMVIGEQ